VGRAALHGAGLQIDGVYVQHERAVPYMACSQVDIIDGVYYTFIDRINIWLSFMGHARRGELPA
jgi:hypothetical protein